MSRGAVPIVVTRGGLVPVTFLAVAFAVYSAGARPLLVAGAAALGGLGGAGSLIVHELGHVRAARRLTGVRPARVSRARLRGNCWRRFFTRVARSRPLPRGSAEVLA